jgi:hypothetical protein
MPVVVYRSRVWSRIAAEPSLVDGGRSKRFTVACGCKCSGASKGIDEEARAATLIGVGADAPPRLGALALSLEVSRTGHMMCM